MKKKQTNKQTNNNKKLRKNTVENFSIKTEMEQVEKTHLC